MKTAEEIQTILRSIVARKRAHRKALIEFRAADSELANDRFLDSEEISELRRKLEAARSKVESKAEAVKEAEALLRS
jgi:predicted  nucleic acid-binding Zn-ribbon protein